MFRCHGNGGVRAPREKRAGKDRKFEHPEKNAGKGGVCTPCGKRVGEERNSYAQGRVRYQVSDLRLIG